MSRRATRSTAAFIAADRVRHRFDLHVEPVGDAVGGDDPAAALAAMNAAVERIARRDMSQYQWTYKRFSRRPPGSDEPNPYRQDFR